MAFARSNEHLPFILRLQHHLQPEYGLADAHMSGLQIIKRGLKKLVSNTEHDPMTFVYAVTLVTFSWHIEQLLYHGFSWSNQHLPLRTSSGNISWCRARALRRLRQWACML